MKRLTWLFVLLVAVTPALYAQEPDLGTEAQREAGKQLYDAKCAHCHGEAGDAASIATPYLRPAPRDFTSGTFKFRSTTSGELPTDDDLKRSIRDGMPYTSMPAWEGILSETEITNLAYYIKTFNSDFSGPDGVPELANLPSAPGFSETSAQQGREVYLANQCADCHGDQGRGNGDSAPTLEDEWGFPIRPADLTKRWTFRNGQTREDIYRTFTTGLSGSPMPSYDLSVEESWALVDYVWSLSESDPNYATVLTAESTDGAIDLSQGDALFADAPVAYIPVVGQVVEPGRAFYPGVNGVSVQAVYNQDDVAIRLTWNDMTAETTGSNSPAMDAPLFVPAAADSAGADTSGVYADAIAVLLPSQMPAGVEKPYIMFGDAKNTMDIWFGDLAAQAATTYLGKGSTDIQATEQPLEFTASYEDGQWTAIFKHARQMDDGLTFEEGSFVPIAFSAWDGFNQERGNKRGMTSWYHLYMTPLQTESAALPMAKWGLITLLLELGLVFIVRRKYKNDAVAA